MAENAPQRPEYETLIDQFAALDAQCKQLLEKFSTGNILYDCVTVKAYTSVAEFLEGLKQSFVGFQEHLRQLIDQRNALLQQIGNAMRSTVVAKEDEVRGIDGVATTKEYGAFEVSSRTSRSFDPDVLFTEVQKQGLFQRLIETQVPNKKTGAMEPIVRQEWSIQYEPVKNFLRENNLEDVLKKAYEEEEGTPAVTGPKEMTWIGEERKKK